MWEMYVVVNYVLLMTCIFKAMYSFRYKQHVASFWTTEEVKLSVWSSIIIFILFFQVDLTIDIQDWKMKLTDNERNFIQVKQSQIYLLLQLKLNVPFTPLDGVSFLCRSGWDSNGEPGSSVLSRGATA